MRSPFITMRRLREGKTVRGQRGNVTRLSEAAEVHRLSPGRVPESSGHPFRYARSVVLEDALQRVHVIVDIGIRDSGFHDRAHE